MVCNVYCRSYMIIISCRVVIHFGDYVDVGLIFAFENELKEKMYEVYLLNLKEILGFILYFFFYVPLVCTEQLHSPMNQCILKKMIFHILISFGTLLAVYHYLHHIFYTVKSISPIIPNIIMERKVMVNIQSSALNHDS